MDNFNYKKYLKDNRLLREEREMTATELAHVVNDITNMVTPEDNIEELITYLADNPEELPDTVDPEFIWDFFDEVVAGVTKERYYRKNKEG